VRWLRAGAGARFPECTPHPSLLAAPTPRARARAGQAYPILPRVSECFECQPKPIPKRYPLCTIRSTPDRPVHCVVWAQELHKLLLGDPATSMLFEGDVADDDGAAAVDGGATAGGAGGGGVAARESVYMHLVASRPAPEEGAPDGGAAFQTWLRTTFDAVFDGEIRKRIAMSASKPATTAAPPVPLPLSAIESGAIAAEGKPAASGLPEQAVDSLAGSAATLLRCVTTAHTDAVVRSTLGSRVFDKDSPLDLDFVTAAANLRAHTYHIERQSRWEVKSIAGNIIPAIATTNAIVAGMQVVEVIRILHGDDMMQCGR
jgi:ubiquitin-like 1-activating enzyme E1 B